MSSEEKQSMMMKMMGEFFASMTSEEKKELMKQMMPKMMEKLIEGMTVEDKQELMGSIMPAMMSQMFGGEGGMPSMMMQMMRSMMDGESAIEDFFASFIWRCNHYILVGKWNAEENCFSNNV